MTDVVGDVVVKDAFEVSTTEDHHPIEAFTTHGADKALGEPVGPGSLDRGADDADTFGLEDLVRILACWTTQELVG